MDVGGGDVVLDTLDLLEWRLRRIEFVLKGDVDKADRWDNDMPVLKKLQKLEDGLRKLTEQSGPIYEIVKLHSRHPELFQDSTGQDATPGLDTRQKLAMVELEGPAFHATASQLTSLNDFPLPPLKSFTSLVSLQPQIAQIEARQIEQAKEISELRKRSAILLYRWHEVLVLGQGRCWVEWDTRMRKVERSVRREEVRLSD